MFSFSFLFFLVVWPIGIRHTSHDLYVDEDGILKQPPRCRRWLWTLWNESKQPFEIARKQRCARARKELSLNTHSELWVRFVQQQQTVCGKVFCFSVFVFWCFCFICTATEMEMMCQSTIYGKQFTNVALCIYIFYSIFTLEAKTFRQYFLFGWRSIVSLFTARCELE